MDRRIWIRFRDRLAADLDSDCLLVEAPDLDKYARDETEDFVIPPDAALLPATEEWVSRIMGLASEFGIPVTPRGGGTGLSGGALALCGGISLSLERMKAVLEIDTQNMVARVQPGVITAELQAAVEEKGLFYPPDPASRESCTIGGNLAEDAGGPRALKYGVTSAYVRGLRAVLPSGEIIATGGKTLKDVAGYNLAQLLVGSEGTLAVITEATLRLLPLPTCRRTLIAPFDDLDDAARSVPAMLSRGIVPAALEFMECPAVRAAERHLETVFPHSDAAALLLIELDGFDEDRVEKEFERVGEVLVEEGARDVLFAESRSKQEKLWKIRRALGEAAKSVSNYRELDTAVPRRMIPDLVRSTHAICERFDVDLLCYGHAGDGNLHMNIMQGDLSQDQWKERIPKVTEAVYDLTTSLGGTITGEHGVGIVAKPYLARAVGKRNVELMKGIKQVFDPRGILNPGKIFDENGKP